ncbi:DNA repair protein RecO [Marinicellulosiphila megalodicopiae]|uniref:DNA repair protein RecO n=1 Tax=Marinicellulosiphila megalodicopiae TaxID=2724896 RepID=UPI003BAFD180
MSQFCRCVLLHIRELSESKKILECFSEEYGRIAFVINIDKHSLPEYFRLMDVTFFGQAELKTLQIFEYNQKYLHLAASEQVVALYFNELMFYLTKPFDVHQWLLPLYLTALAKLKQSSDIDMVIREFEFDLLSKIGFGINFEQDIDNQLINEANWYGFLPLKGFAKVLPNSNKSLNGSMLNQLKCKQWQIPPNNKIIQYILTAQIQTILGDRQLQSKQLWPSKIFNKEHK